VQLLGLASWPLVRMPAELLRLLQASSLLLRLALLLLALARLASSLLLLLALLALASWLLLRLALARLALPRLAVLPAPWGGAGWLDGALPPRSLWAPPGPGRSAPPRDPGLRSRTLPDLPSTAVARQSRCPQRPRRSARSGPALLPDASPRDP